MSCVIDVETLINLDSIPPDIIRKIVQLEKLTGELRLISRSWNAIVVEDNNKPLERVYFCSKVPAGRTRNTTFADSESRKGMRKVRMYAKFQERYSNKDNIEVMCDPEDIVREGWRRNIVLLLFLCISFGLNTRAKNNFMEGNTIAWISYGLLGLSFSILTTNEVKFCYERQIRERRKRGLVKRLNRFLTMFSKIESLVLDDLADDSHCLKLDVILQSLKGVSIDRVELRDSNINKRIANHLLKLCRSHNVRHVLLIGRQMSVANFRRLAFNLPLMEVTLDFYDRETSANPLVHLVYFKQPKQFWDEMATELHAKGISMKMRTIHDGPMNGYPAGTRAHFQCAKMDDDNSEFPKPVLRSKGFNVIQS